MTLEFNQKSIIPGIANATQKAELNPSPEAVRSLLQQGMRNNVAEMDHSAQPVV